MIWDVNRWESVTAGIGVGIGDGNRRESVRRESAAGIGDSALNHHFRDGTATVSERKKRSL
jgi:hypothetical protein